MTVRERIPTFACLQQRAQPLIDRARAELIAEGAPATAIRHELCGRHALSRPILRNRSAASAQNSSTNSTTSHRQTFGHAAPELPSKW